MRRVMATVAAVLLATYGCTIGGPTTASPTDDGAEQLEEAFLDQVRGLEILEPDASDARLLEVGHSMCDFLSSFDGEPNEDEAWYHSVKLMTDSDQDFETSRDFIAAVASELCPEYRFMLPVGRR